MNNPRPLSGLTALEFSHTIMGPCAGLIFADLGADVIKVEPVPGGDHTRRLPGFASGFFATYNRNKRSIAVDLKSNAGQAAIHRLVASADIVVENYGPGTMERLNCGWQQLSEINPRLIYLALKGFLAGPYENKPALDEVVQFQSGLAYMTGPPGRPLRAGASIVDILGAVFGVTGVLAALRERDHSGQGQRVGSALFESAVFLMGSHMSGSVVTGEPVPPMPARRGAWGIYDVFETADGEQIFIGVTSDAQWTRFCSRFNVQELAADPRLTNNAKRADERSWLIPKLRLIIGELAYDQAVALCSEAQISWAPVGRAEDLFDDPHLLATQGLLNTAFAGIGINGQQTLQALLPALPLEFGGSRDRLGLERQPPAMGEHNAEVLGAAGFSASEIEDLKTAGILAQAVSDR